MRVKIYGIRHGGEIIYVGQTRRSIENRLRNHLYVSAGGKGNSRVPLLFEHMRANSFTGYTVELLDLVPSEDADRYEKIWILKMRCEKLCNKAPGGIGAPPGAEHPMYGKHHTEETKNKISSSTKGIKKSEETRQRMKAAILRDRHLRTDMHKIKCVETGEVWDSVRECARAHNVRMSAILHRMNNKVSYHRNNAMKGKNFVYV